MKKKLGKETDSIVEIKKEKQDDDVRFFKTCLAKEIRKLFIHPKLQAQSFQSKYSLKQAVMSYHSCVFRYIFVLHVHLHYFFLLTKALCFPFQIREDWKFVAMVVDRLQLYVFFIVTTVGTIGILMDAPHIFEYVDQDKIIDIYRGK